jgi:hypothetical protein
VKHGSEVCEAGAVIKDVMEMFPQGLSSFVISTGPFSYIPGSIVRGIVSLELIDLPEFSRLSEELIGVEALTLSKLPKIVDISGISKSRNIKSVRLDHCSTISNEALSPLNGIKDVTVRFCDSITDINYLGNHESFNLWSTKAVAQVTTLKNLIRCKNLYIYCASFETCDNSCLENVSNKLNLFSSAGSYFPLPLNQFDGTSLKLRGFKLTNSTFLRNCPNLTELYLSDCKGIDIIDFQTNVLPILSLQSLSLYNFSDIVNTNSMGKIKCLCFGGLSSLVSLQSLGAANRQVSIISLPQVVDFSPLQHVRDLFINSCSNLIDVSVLKNVKILSILGCLNVTDVSGLESCEYLHLHTCLGIRSLKGVKHIKKILVDNCESLEDIDELKGREDVKISDCPKAK